MKKIISLCLSLVMAVSLISVVSTDKVYADVECVGAVPTSNTLVRVTTDDVVWYKYVTKADTAVRFTTNSGSADDSCIKYWVAAYDEDESRISDTYVVKKGTDYSTCWFTYPKNTVLYVKVDFDSNPLNIPSRSCILRCDERKVTKLEVESNNTDADATPFTTSISGSTYLDDDYLVWKAKDTGFVKFTVDNKDGNNSTEEIDNMTVRISDSLGSSDAEEYSVGYNTKFKVVSRSIPVKKGQKITLHLNGTSDNAKNALYTVKATFNKKKNIEAEDNGSIINANPLKKTVTGSLSSWRDEDYYAFTTTKGSKTKEGTTTIVFDIVKNKTLSKPGYLVVVYDENNNVVEMKENVSKKTTFKVKAVKGSTFSVCVTSMSNVDCKNLYTVTLK